MPAPVQGERHPRSHALTRFLPAYEEDFLTTSTAPRPRSSESVPRTGAGDGLRRALVDAMQRRSGGDPIGRRAVMLSAVPTEVLRMTWHPLLRLRAAPTARADSPDCSTASTSGCRQGLASGRVPTLIGNSYRSASVPYRRAGTVRVNSRCFRSSISSCRYECVIRGLDHICPMRRSQ